MPKIIIHQEKIQDAFVIFTICPYGALEMDLSGQMKTNFNCRLCKICVKTGPI